MFFVLSFLWFIRTTKAILFWLYLWQLKEYHLGRFLDHFRAEKGKQLLINKLIILKLTLFLLLIGANFMPWLKFSVSFFLFSLLIIYFLESAKGFFDFFQKKLKMPIFTKKIIFLFLITLFFTIFYLSGLWRTPNFIFLILAFDILTPAVVSGIVLIFQPLAVLGKNQIIRKAIKKREKFKDLLVIGITGSYGKTSTKEFLATILSEKFKVLKTKEHQNSEVGISQCILNDLNKEYEIFVVEMGAYNRGGIKLLCNIAKPKIGILTGINEQHLALQGSLENIIKTKYELIQSLPRDGLAIFNGDNPYCFDLYQRTIYPKKTYSLQPSISGFPVDIWTDEIKIEKDNISFKVIMKNDQADFKINLLGAQNILNILAATLVAKELGMSLAEISKACQKIKPEQSGVFLKKGINDLNIIDATYSANPDGVIWHLEYLKIWPKKKVLVMPCLIELGQASKKIHKRIGQKIAEVCDLAIITTKERFKEIKDGVLERGAKEENILFIENPKKIFERIKSFCRSGDVILLESRVPAELIKELLL